MRATTMLGPVFALVAVEVLNDRREGRQRRRQVHGLKAGHSKIGSLVYKTSHLVVAHLRHDQVRLVVPVDVADLGSQRLHQGVEHGVRLGVDRRGRVIVQSYADAVLCEEFLHAIQDLCRRFVGDRLDPHLLAEVQESAALHLVGGDRMPDAR